MLRTTLTIRRRDVLGGLLVALASVVSPAGRAGAPDARAGIQFTGAWIRWLPAGLPGAGYVTLTNTGSAEQVLIGASSPDYADVSVHQSVNRDGLSEMIPVTSLVLKPRATVQFAEGGYHLMLMQPKRALQPGDTVTVIFRMRDGHSISVPFNVRADGGS